MKLFKKKRQKSSRTKERQAKGLQDVTNATSTVNVIEKEKYLKPMEEPCTFSNEPDVSWENNLLRENHLVMRELHALEGGYLSLLNSDDAVIVTKSSTTSRDIRNFEDLCLSQSTSDEPRSASGRSEDESIDQLNLQDGRPAYLLCLADLSSSETNDYYHETKDIDTKNHVDRNRLTHNFDHLCSLIVNTTNNSTTKIFQRAKLQVYSPNKN